MNPFITALLWAPLSFCLHVGMHEGSHALMATALGHKVDHFGFTAQGNPATFFVSEEWSLSHEALIDAAPAMFDSVYAPLMLGLASGQPSDANLRAILLVESVMSSAFFMVWCLGAFTRGPNTDGYKFEQATGFTPTRGLIIIPLGYLLGSIPLIMETKWL